MISSPGLLRAGDSFGGWLIRQSYVDVSGPFCQAWSPGQLCTGAGQPRCRHRSSWGVHALPLHIPLNSCLAALCCWRLFCILTKGVVRVVVQITCATTLCGRQAQHMHAGDRCSAAGTLFVLHELHGKRLVRVCKSAT